MTDAILAKLNVRIWGASRTDADITSEVHATKGAEKDAGRYVKNLVTPKALKDIRSVGHEMRLQHYHMTRPWDDSGRRLLPANMIPRYQKQMEKLEAEYMVAARAFEAAYPELIEQAKQSLGAMFNDTEYPHPSSIIDKFGANVSYEPIPTGAAMPMTLQDREALVQEVETTTRSQMKASADALFHRTVKELRSAHSRIDAYDEKLNDDKPTRFKSSVLQEIARLADILPSLNIENDPFLDGIAKRLKSELLEIHADDVRSNQVIRSNLISALDGMAEDTQTKIAGRARAELLKEV